MSVWLTYADAAERFGVSAEAVRQLAIRHRWPRRRPNADPHGRVEVEVPSDFEARPRTGVGHPFERPSDTRSTSEVDAWRDRAERAEWAADLERERADQAEKRADAADADRRAAVVMIDGFAARADRAEQATAAERVRADALRDRIEAMRADLDQANAHAQAAQDRAEQLRQADAAWWARGRLARVRAAWRRRPDAETKRVPPHIKIIAVISLLGGVALLGMAWAKKAWTTEVMIGAAVLFLFAYGLYFGARKKLKQLHQDKAE